MAVDSLHTPGLYSTLLRALISAKIDTSSKSLDSPPLNEGQDGTGRDPNQMLSTVAQEPRIDETAKSLIPGPSIEAQTGFLNFQSTGEMGPVADVTTFPPRMASSDTEETAGSMSMESILSNDFWDSVLVPGMVILCEKLNVSLFICFLGYSNSLEGLSGGFVYGAGGNSVYIASRWGSPDLLAANSPLLSVRPELTNSLT